MTSPVSLPAGKKLLASDFDAYENLTAAPGAYTVTWTTTGTAPALGNGTLTGAYSQVGKLVLFQIAFTAGSTTTFGTGTWYFSLPVVPNHAIVVVGRINDSGTWYVLHGVLDSNKLLLTHTNMTAVTATAPMTWATGDQALMHGWFWTA